jgi:hypothetical protein
VTLASGSLDYDFLVVATGATHAYFGHDDWAPHAPGLKTLDDAFEIRRRVLAAFEAAEREPDPARRKQWLEFVLIGGGPDRRRAGRHAGRDRAPYADRRVPRLRSRRGGDPPASRPARAYFRRCPKRCRATRSASSKAWV